MVTCVVFHLKLPVKGISMFMSSIDLDFSTVTHCYMITSELYYMSICVMLPLMISWAKGYCCASWALHSSSRYWSFLFFGFLNFLVTCVLFHCLIACRGNEHVLHVLCCYCNTTIWWRWSTSICSWTSHEPKGHVGLEHCISSAVHHHWSLIYYLDCSTSWSPLNSVTWNCIENIKLAFFMFCPSLVSIEREMTPTTCVEWGTLHLDHYSCEFKCEPETGT